MPIYRLNDRIAFPPPHLADDGLLAVGGDLRPERLMAAYRNGIFPWYSEGEPILWWSPDPRAVIHPEGMHVSRSLERTLRSGRYTITADSAFAEVIGACAAIPRRHERGTWITDGMRAAYTQLHELGHAHSIECWEDGALVGGLYGLAIGTCFCGESMFARRDDASKAAFATFARACPAMGITLIDCQLPNPHLMRLGAREIPRAAYLRLLAEARRHPAPPAPWRLPTGG